MSGAGPRAVLWALLGALQVAFLVFLISQVHAAGEAANSIEPNPPVAVQLHQACTDGIDTMMTLYTTRAQCLKAQRPVITAEYEQAALENQQTAAAASAAGPLGIAGCWAATDLIAALVYVARRRPWRSPGQLTQSHQAGQP